MTKLKQIFKNGPDNVQGFLFMTVIKLFEIKMFKWFKWLVKYFILGISPNVPYDLIAFFRKKNRILSFVLLYLVTFCCTFLVFYVWTKIDGTYEGNDANYYYFSQDKNNFINYTVIVPLYISIGMIMFSTIISGFGRYFSSTQERVRKNRQYSIFITLGLAFLVSSFITINYFDELRNPAFYKQRFWCFNSVTLSKERILSTLGLYYMLVTFILMFLSTLFICSIFSFFKFSIMFSSRITPENYNETSDIYLIKSQLKDFIIVYIFAKLLAGIYILNYYTWLNQHPVRSDNLVFMKIAITFFAITFVSLPRYYIENKWYDFKLNLFFKNEILKAEYEKILSRPQSLLISFIDLFLIGNIISDLWIQKSVVDLFSLLY